MVIGRGFEDTERGFINVMQLLMSFDLLKEAQLLPEIKVRTHLNHQGALLCFRG
jgi:hypothetical protein